MYFHPYLCLSVSAVSFFFPPLIAFKLFFPLIPGFKQFDVIHIGYNFLHIYCTWDLPNFLDLRFHSFIELGNLGGIFSSNAFPIFLSSETTITQTFGCLILPPTSLFLLIFMSLSLTMSPFGYFYCCAFRSTNLCLICHYYHPVHFSPKTLKFSCLKV